MMMRILISNNHDNDVVMIIGCVRRGSHRSGLEPTTNELTNNMSVDEELECGPCGQESMALPQERDSRTCGRAHCGDVRL